MHFERERSSVDRALLATILDLRSSSLMINYLLWARDVKIFSIVLLAAPSGYLQVGMITKRVHDPHRRIVKHMTAFPLGRLYYCNPNQLAMVGSDKFCTRGEHYIIKIGASANS